MKKIFLFFFLIFSLSIGKTQSDTSYFQSLDKILLKTKGKIKVDTILAMPYDIMAANFSQAENYFHLALKTAKKSKYALGEAMVKQKLAMLHYYSGEYDSTSYYAFSALDDFIRLQQWDKAGNLYCDYGHMIKRRDLKKAFELMRKGLSLLEKKSTPPEISTCLNNFGVLQEMNNDVDSALFYYRSSLTINRKIKDSIAIPYNMVQIATALLIQKKYEEAKMHIDTAHFIRLKRNDELGITDDQAYYGDLYKAWKKYDLAIPYFKECIKLAATSGYPYLIQYSHEQLAECYEATGDAKNALKSYREAAKIKDSLLQEKNTKTMMELEEKFRSAEDKKTIAEKSEKISKQDLDLEKKSRENLLLYGGLIVVLLGGFALTLLIVQREKQKRQKAILSERNKGLKAVIESSEIERRRIARDLHDGIGQQLGGLKMGWQQVGKNLPDEEKKKLEALTKILNETSAEVRELSHRMMPKMLEEEGLIPAIEDMLAKTLGLTSIKFEFNHGGFKERLSQELELAVYRIAQESIANILKHAEAKKVLVDLYLQERKLTMMIEDDGKGVNLVGTNHEGLGLQNLRGRAAAVNGNIRLESEAGKGTTVIFTAQF